MASCKCGFAASTASAITRLRRPVLFAPQINATYHSGATDPHGESPADRPVSPEDIACTVFDRLGIDPRRELHTRDGRPIKLVDGGQAIRELV